MGSSRAIVACVRRILRVTLAIGFLAFTAVAEADTASTKVRDDYMTPHFRVLVTGDTMRWEVEGSNGHTVTSYPGSPRSFDSSRNTTDACSTGGLFPTSTDCLERGDTFEVTFLRPGTYDYYCKIHGDPNVRPTAGSSATQQPCGMCGQIIVKNASTSRPATRRPVATATRPAEASASPSPSPSASPSNSSDPALDPSVVGSQDPGGGFSTGTGRLVISVVAIALLAGLGYLVWRRFLAPS